VTLRNIPIDISRLSMWLCTSAPEVRSDPTTGQVRTDRDSGQPLYLVGVLVKVDGDRKGYVLDVQVPGEPSGLTEGETVLVSNLEAAPWERDGRSGVTYRAASIVPAPAAGSGAATAAPAPSAESAPSSASSPGRPNSRGGGSS
jgi:hypothetical protein